MTITPSLQAVEFVSQITARTLQNFYHFIETEENHDKPEEIMVLMLSFCTGLIIQLQNKIATLEKGLRNKFLDALNEAIKSNSDGIAIIKKLGMNDLSLKKSSFRIDPSDLSAAIEFLENNIRNSIKTNLDAIPFVLRTETTLFNALAMVLANLFNSLDSNNVNSMIDAFSENIRVFAK